jgi:hypothetical protein
LDGDWIITAVDPINRKVSFRVDNVNSSSSYSGGNSLKTIGIVDLSKIALYSVPFIKNNLLSTDAVIIDKIENIFGFSGLSTSFNQITRSLLSKDQDNFYSFKNREYVHICDNEGRLLDWEHGQIEDPEPVVGYTSYNDSIYGESLLGTNWLESALPQSYNGADVSLSSSNFSNIPFYVDSINDDVFNTSSILIKEVNIAIKNDPLSTGNEDLKYVLTKGIKTIGFDGPRFCNVQTGTTSTVRINESDPLFLANITTSSFIIIHSGKGKGQISKVVSKNLNGFNVETLPIPIDPTSTYIAFSSYSDVVGSDGVITSSEINSQVITGINGSFGLNGEYRKLKLKFTSSSVDLKETYFIRISQNNAIAPNPAWSSPPRILISSFNSTDTYWSPFAEIYYTSIEGTYGTIDSQLLIEDDLGNISTPIMARQFEPHFRPIKYQLLSRGLDDALIDNKEPLSEDIVFVDVHTGRLRFKKGSEPRNVYVSYYRKESSSGDLSDFDFLSCLLISILQLKVLCRC